MTRITAALAAAMLALSGCQSAQAACAGHGGVARTHNQWAICGDGTWHSMDA